MKRHFAVVTYLKRSWHRYSVWLLHSFWILGFATGIFLAVSCQNILVPMMRGIVTARVSISGLLVVALLPFLLSCYAISLSDFWLLLFIGAAKAFGFGFCACGVSLAFGNSSWLIRILLLFTDCFAVPLLYLFSLRHISGRASRAQRDMAIVLSIMAITSLVDYIWISPFLAALFI